MGNREHRRANKHERERTIDSEVRRCLVLNRAKHREKVFEELEKPVFWGYSRHFHLRPDVAQRNDASRWRSILNLIQNVEYSRRKDFKQRRWPSKRWMEWEHQLKTLGTREFHRRIPARYQVHFRYHYVNGRRRYYFLHPWMMVSKRTKVYHTHREVLDLEMEGEIAYLDRRIEDGLYWQNWHRRNGRHGYKWMPWNDVKTRKEIAIDRYHEDQVKEALLEFHEQQSIFQP